MKSKLMQDYSEKASIEEFIEAGNVPTPAVNAVNTVVPAVDVIEDFGGPTEDPVVEIEQANTVADQLDELATDVDAITHVNGMESYGRIYHQMVGNLGFDLPSQPGLESFAKTHGGKRSLARQIRSHANHLRRVATLGLEDYVDSVDTRLESLTEEYRRAIKELDAIRPNLDVPDSDVEIDQKAIWKMFHVDGKLIKSPSVIGEEESNLRAMAANIRQAVNKIIQDKAEGNLLDSNSYEMLYNRNIKVGDKSVKVNDLGTPKADRAYSPTDIAWIVGWTIFFQLPGLIGSLIFKSKTGEEKTKSTRSKQEMLMFVDTVKKFATIVKDVDDDIAKLKKYIDSQEDPSGYKKDSSPVFQLALFVVQQCTDLAKGSRVLFGKIANA